MVRQLEAGQMSALQAIEALLSVELSFRETRRIKVALGTSRLMPPKTLESFDFAFQPSLDRERIYALAGLNFVARAEIVHLLGPPGTGKSHFNVEWLLMSSRLNKLVLLQIFSLDLTRH